MAAIAAALARLVRRGLPVTAVSAHPVLLGLRGVLARAVDPAEEASRVCALDGLLRGLLARFPDTRYAEATRALFGLPPAEPGANLTARRAVAARAAGHEVHHFRKRVEPRLIARLAGMVLADADRFTRSRWVAPRLAPATGRQPVPADPFAWELAEQEEALCRLWAAIYALRAELLAVERLMSLGADRQRVVGQAVTAAWRWGRASAEASDCVSAFGAGEWNGGGSVPELLALAGWAPELSADQRTRLIQAAGGAAGEAFVTALHAESDVGRAWVGGLLTSLAPEDGLDGSDIGDEDNERHVP